MRVRFIDTSIIMNLLEIPYMCADAGKIRAEFKAAVKKWRDFDFTVFYYYRKWKSYCTYL